MNDSAPDFANDLLRSWSSSLLEWTSTSCEISDESKRYKDIWDPAQLSPGSKVFVRIVVSDDLQASYKTLLGSGWEQEVSVADSSSKERLAGYTQIDDDDDDEYNDDDNDDDNDRNVENSDFYLDSRGHQKDVQDTTKEKCIYVTGNILSCDWRHPKVF